MSIVLLLQNAEVSRKQASFGPSSSSTGPAHVMSQFEAILWLLLMKTPSVAVSAPYFQQSQWGPEYQQGHSPPLLVESGGRTAPQDPNPPPTGD
ncbi:Hypothetical predicted protein [Podarcis lilfordi]|uniref:Uncharacterized protein n=1 Tax=Podarcis lilfordi TaxID=74358 RepID=A0AA35P4W7_9SAUR|nr:Hypothetical predicted protein [Podarcis lilfordi]